MQALWVTMYCVIQGRHFYGIRRYTRGSVLYSHVDRVSTHVISVIINIEQMVDEVSLTIALS